MKAEMEKVFVREAESSLELPAKGNGRGGLTVVEPSTVYSIEDFWAFLPDHKYIYAPTGDPWPAASVDAVLGSVADKPAHHYLDRERAVQQMTWVPGEPAIIEDRLLKDGGLVKNKGSKIFNLYHAPPIQDGDPKGAGPWLNHIDQVYEQHAEHLISWCAHRVQRPAEKPNHAIILGGGQGIGKDTILRPVKTAVGTWNVSEIAPHTLFGRFNAFAKSVVLSISEARDLGDADRYGFYERLKTYTTAPPDVLRVDEKNLREHSIPNVCGVVITTNHLDALYIPADDRRSYVAWSDADRADFDDGYWRGLYAWMDQEGGNQNVAAFLREFDLSNFDAKCPPPKTDVWQRIVDSGRAPEDAELDDTIDALGRPSVLTLALLVGSASGEFREWLTDRRNRRIIPHRLKSADYEPVRNDAANDGLWKISGKRQAIYAKRELTVSERIAAARELL